MRRAALILAAIALALATAGVAMARGEDSQRCAENRPFLPWRWGKPRGPHFKGIHPALEVSEEFRQKVMEIAKADPDVRELLDAGYENVGIRPIIRATVQGNGDVALRASSAVLMLRREGGRAMVHVDVEAEKVTKIVKVEWTVIEKS
ncbi:MAG: hypothetical protein NZ934_00090 [Hadesarchaea archaeon]|nr:hypothetical protein [Hadesarchaea archaeon]